MPQTITFDHHDSTLDLTASQVSGGEVHDVGRRMALNWTKGEPPEMLQSERLLIIGTQISARAADAAEDNRPELFVVAYRPSHKHWAPIMTEGDSPGDPGHRVVIHYWAEIGPLPNAIELRKIKV